MPSLGVYDAAAGRWSVGTLLAGDPPATLAVDAVVERPGPIVNSATLTGGDQSDPDRGNDSAAAVLNGPPASDLGLEKTVDAVLPAVGDVVTFTITVVNHGPAPASDVRVAEALPPALAFLSAAASRGTYDVAGGLWRLDALDVGQSATLAISAAVQRADAATNDATVSVAGFDPNRMNDRAGVTLNAPDAVDLQVTKTASADTVPQGEDATFVIVVRNDGAATATGVEIADALPDGLTLVAATPSQGRYDAATGRWLLGTLAPRARETLVVAARAEGVGTLVNTAARLVADQADVFPANDTDTAPVTVIPPPGADVDLALVKRAAPAVVPVGDRVTYTLEVTNRGAGPATGVVVTDVLPAQVRFESAVASPGSCGVDADRITCGLGTVVAGTTASVTIQATRLAAEAFVNQASVTAEQPDANPSDNASAAATGVVAEGDCDNCLDDDGDGLVDVEDPDCCAAAPLTVSRARLTTRPGSGAPSMLRVRGTMANDVFAGLDPRDEDVRVQLRTGAGPVLCCTIPSEKWMRLYRRVYGFWDQRLRLCPPLKDMSLALPKQNPSRLYLLAAGVAPQTLLAGPIDVAVGAGGRCAAGSFTLRRKNGATAVSP
jgi:uncharacterized repeat protein (TIGR01451 family)